MVKLEAATAYECVAVKFLKLPNVQKYEVVEKEEQRFVSEIEMEDGFSFRLSVYILTTAYPSTIKSLCPEMKNAVSGCCAIVAPYISDRTAKICQENKTGYFDFAGNCWFMGHSIYISERGNPNPSPKPRAQISFFERSSAVSSLILRALFQDLKKTWRLKYLAEDVGCSIGQVSKVLNFLLQNLWAEKTSAGYHITEPEAVLKEWSLIYGKRTPAHYDCYTLETPSMLEERLRRINKDNSIEYYLTGFSGGVRYAPVIRYNRVHVYLSPEDIREAIDLLEIKEVGSGANVTIYPLQDESCLKDCRIIGQDSVVSPVQIYLDCMQLKGRGEEMAETVMNREILK